MRAVSLFTNCGAGDIGFRRAGFHFDVLAEIDVRRLSVAALNHPESVTVPGDLRSTWALVRDRYLERAGNERPDLLSACPPCQGLSSARGGRGDESDPDAGVRDGRNLLVIPIAKVAMALQPRTIVVENVTAFLTRQVRHPETHEPISGAELLISELSDDYTAFASVIDLAHYGVPQRRRRCFLTFIRNDEPAVEIMRDHGVAPFPHPTHGSASRPAVNLNRALKRMGFLALDAKFGHRAQDPYRPMHCVPTWKDHHYAMVAAIPKGTGGSAWQNTKCARCGTVNVTAEDAMCPACNGPLLRPVVREKNDAWRLIRGFRSSSYRRMSSDCPASTVTTASGHIGSDSTIHPWENRVLSPLECAELQTIPRSFNWGDALSRFGSGFMRDIIGEAVPPRFTERHGRVIRKLLNGKIDRTFLQSSDIRCARASARLMVKVNAQKTRTR